MLKLLSVSKVVCLAILMSQSVVAAEYELHYFTQNHDICPPCVSVSKIVTSLQNQGREIHVHNFQQSQKAFDFYSVDVTPSFVLLKDGQVYRRYVQSEGYKFTGQMLMGIAPPADKAPDDCANPIAKVAKAVKNLLPPPPAPGLPADIPDRAKVKRIEDLEAMLRDLQLTVNVLRAELKDVKGGKDGRDGKDGIAGKDGRDGVDGKAGRDGVDNRPIEVRIEIVDDSGTVVGTRNQTYPRGTPLVLRFHEKLLSK